MDNLSRLADLRKKQLTDSRIDRDIRNKDRFRSICKKKFQTCFVFPIAEFENVFGQKLMGIGLPESELTDEQKENMAKWNQLRKSILDNGNNQLRATLREIELYDISYIGYRCEFHGIDVKEQNNGKN